VTNTDPSAVRRRRAFELRNRAAIHGEALISFYGHSMAPSLRDGDRLRVRGVSLDDLVPGDIIVFTRGEHTVVHRLLYLSGAGDTALCLRTKGDNASACDPAALFGRVSCILRDGEEIPLSGRRWRAGALAIAAFSLTEGIAAAVVRALRGRRWRGAPVQTRGSRRLRAWRSRARMMGLRLLLGLTGR
jgi:hypothetical protein